MNRTVLGVLALFPLWACSGGGSDRLDGHLTADPRGFSSGGSAQTAPPGAEAAASAGELAEAIREANLYQFEGDYLYLLNAWNGFIVVDLARPARTGSLALGGVPVEMFLRGERVFVLLTTYVGGTELIEISVADPTQPVRVATHGLAGEFKASRLVGDRLLVAAGDAVHSFSIEPDLALVSSLTIPGGVQFVHATDTWLYVAAPETSGATGVTLVEIAGPAGGLVLTGSLSLSGFVSDEYKLHFGAGHLRVVTHDPLDNGLSRLFVVDVSSPAAPYVRSSLEIVRGEQLFATRFTEDQAYIVTFEQVDPLWVVDLADPDRPQITASLEVPGWSTHLVTLPNQRLVALGIDPAQGWQAIVSLFDVSDPTLPVLESRVDFGWGWSSAFEDVRGFGVFPEEGLVLVPFAAETNRLGVVRLDGNALTVQGSIDTEGTVLRGFPHPQGLCSLGAEELVRVDPATLSVTGRVTLASNVVDVARLANGTLIEAVQRSAGLQVGGVDLPLSLSRMYVHGDIVALTGWDPQGPAAFVVDFAAVPPGVSARIALGTPTFPYSPPGGSGGFGLPGTGGSGWGAQEGVLTDAGRLALPGLPAETPGVSLGSGDLQDGFTVIDLPMGRVTSVIGVRGAHVSGFLALAETLVLTHARYVGDDGSGRPLLRHELVQVDLATLASSTPVNVPGYVVSISGARTYTVEETWGQSWSFVVAVVASEIVGDRALVRERLLLPEGAYDFRLASDTLWFSAYDSVVISWPVGSPVTQHGPDGRIGTVRLGTPLAFGPELVFDRSFGSLLLGQASAALVIVDGVVLEHWELSGTAAARTWSLPLGTWPQAAREDAVPGTYVLALGYGGALSAP